MTWDDILADRSLRNLPYRIETNGHNQIMLTPSGARHGVMKSCVAVLLHGLLPGGRTTAGAPVQTGDGVRVADVAWISLERREPHRRATVLPVAPEICVEILSPSNTRVEMLEKMTLLYSKGAHEVWLCDEAGRMEFFTAASAPNPVPASVLCPAFPKQINVD